MLYNDDMMLYSQKDPKWKNKRIGSCADTFGQSGCNVTAMATLCGKTPEEVNAIVPYRNGCLLSDSTACTSLGLEYLGRQSTPPSFICKAETDHYKNKGVPQHFFVWRPDGMIADPLDYPCTWKKNPYNIVSFRLIKPITEESMEKEFVKAVSDLLGKNYGDNLNEGEQKDAAKRIGDIDEYVKSLENSVDEKSAIISDLADKANELVACVETKRDLVAKIEELEKIHVATEIRVPAENMTWSEHLGWAIQKLLPSKK